MVHRVIPTALFLNRATVYHTPNCHRCNVIENIEHPILHCPTSTSFWTKIQTYLDKMTDNKLRLTDNIKLFRVQQTNNIIHDKATLNLVNWTLTTTRCATHKSAVNYHTKQITTTPQELFSASAKAHITCIYKYSKSRNNDVFTSTWCIRSALVSLSDHKLVFHL